jgi:hypothetical protein|nr:MAG TPA: mature oligodendrocyte transmembrane protein [Bacteriophage sp.]
MATRNSKKYTSAEKLGELIGYVLVAAFAVAGLMFMIKGFVFLYEWLF